MSCTGSLSHFFQYKENNRRFLPRSCGFPPRAAHNKVHRSSRRVKYSSVCFFLAILWKEEEYLMKTLRLLPGRSRAGGRGVSCEAVVFLPRAAHNKAHRSSRRVKYSSACFFSYFLMEGGGFDERPGRYLQGRNRTVVPISFTTSSNAFSVLSMSFLSSGYSGTAARNSGHLLPTGPGPAGRGRVRANRSCRRSLKKRRSPSGPSQ